MKKVRSVPMVFNHLRFANDILASRLELKMTNAEIAHITGLSSSAVSDYENGGENNMKMENFLRFCNAFDLNPQDYFELKV